MEILLLAAIIWLQVDALYGYLYPAALYISLGCSVLYFVCFIIKFVRKIIHGKV